MAWETEKLHRTLLIEILPPNNGRKRYAIHPLVRVTNDVGTSYLEPIPYEFLVSGTRDIWRFDAVEFIDPVAIDRNDKRGDLGLTNFGGRAVRRGA